MENSLAIANYFIDKSFDTSKDLTPMKLVKLVYIAHGWHLGLYNEPLISEPIYAWKYGPVVKNVYDNFKHFGNSQITNFAFTHHQGKNIFFKPSDDKTDEFLNKIWEVYSDFNGIELSTLTHQDGTPWDRVTKESLSKWGMLIKDVVIPESYIKEHYQALANERTK